MNDRTGSHRGMLGATAVMTLLLDQMTKIAARAALPPCNRPPAGACERIPLAGPAELIRVANEGSALGFGQGMAAWPVLAATALVLVVLLTRYARSSRMMALGTGLLLGGAGANLIDRLVFGHVTDFIGLTWGPSGGIVLNTADIALIVGSTLASVALRRALFRR